MVDFCKKCGAILLSADKEAKCPSCGHINKIENAEQVISQKIDKKELEIKEAIKETHSVVEMECPKCKNNRAYFWSKQTRASDEPETQFFKCTKCGYQWRNYG